MEKYKHLVRKGILDLPPYIPGTPIEQIQEESGIEDILKLASNETSVVSPLARQAICRESQSANYYPEGLSTELRRALAGKLNVDPDMLLVSGGANNVILLIGQAFIDAGDEVILADLTFPAYETITRIMQGSLVKLPLKNFANDLNAVAASITDKTKLIFLCNPNNPTGGINTRAELEEFLPKVPEDVIVVLDEAYIDYVSSPDYPVSIDYLNDPRPIIGLRTFSKLAGLAGARIGYAISNIEIVDVLRRVLEPFPVSRLAQAAALASLDDHEHMESVVAQNRSGREYFHREFDQLGLSYSPSEANFVFVKVDRDADTVYEKMLTRGVIIRPSTTWRTGDYIRITVGTPEQNERCMRALREVLKELSED